MSSVQEENTCRICRCEGTDDDPLFYPCKCRGSIKFIHQDCLMEWLNHSKRDPVCDICHTPYKFRIIYDENMPNFVPIHLILKKFFINLKNLLHFSITIIALVLLVVFQIPVFFKFTSRVFTWIIDSRKPFNSNLKLSFLFGQYFLYPNHRNHNITNIIANQTIVTLDHEAQFLSTFKFNTFSNYLLFFRNTFFIGFIYLFIIIIIHILLFIVHEWIRRDPSFSK
ncbi:zf-C3HC4-domain-containing protein, partial [Ascoidea rubescens DSM 1968]